MPHRSDPRLLVLLGLRLRGFAEPEELAPRTGLDEAVVAREVTRMAERGLVVYRAGAVSGWILTAAGRREGERLLCEELDTVGCRTVVEDAYRSFLAMNPDLLRACTDWQIRPESTGTVANDHDDPSYDAAVLERLAALHAGVGPVVESLAGVLDRFAGYGSRLAYALDRLRWGDRDWFTRPTLDSYHTVWFELHEDLLATLGYTRGEEPSLAEAGTLPGGGR